MNTVRKIHKLVSVEEDKDLGPGDGNADANENAALYWIRLFVSHVHTYERIEFISFPNALHPKIFIMFLSLIV